MENQEKNQEQISLNLKEFNFSKINKIKNYNTNSQLLQEARNRKFYNGNTSYNKLFSSLFFLGGNLKFKNSLDENFKKEAWTYCRNLMSSFSPRHEEKEAVCAMLMSELLEIN